MRKAAKVLGGFIERIGARIWEWGAKPDMERVKNFYMNGLGNTGQPW